MPKTILIILLLIVGSAAVVTGKAELLLGSDKKSATASDVIAIDSSHKPGQLAFADDIKPLLDKRCAGCHSGYEAPCGLELNSAEGLLRGAHKQRPIRAWRQYDLNPTRLFIDATTTSAWRDQDFFPVINEKASFPEINLNRSLIAKLLVQKTNNPLTPVGKLSSQLFTRSPECPTLDEIAKFQHQHPLAGMPYALPSLSETEQRTLLNWLQDGAKTGAAAKISNSAQDDIKKWEQFFNEPAAKNKLVSRYIYEHLHQAWLRIKNQNPSEFYRLVRSKTPTGQTIDELKTRYPSSASETENFYYRLRLITETPVAKNYLPYELSDDKLQRYRELFLQTDTPVTPSEAHTTNPFIAFKPLPISARYQFLLDDLEFFINGIAKSPAFALAAVPIPAQVWLAFIKPLPQYDDAYAQLIDQHSLAFASLDLLAWGQQLTELQAYWTQQRQFIDMVLLKQQPLDLNLLWQGDNAAISLFRHTDNASVLPGLHGKTPPTAWVLDYPLLERLHYLLVAHFSPYDNTPKHWATRLAVDWLRREAEDNFWQFLPKKEQQAQQALSHYGLDGQLTAVIGKPSFNSAQESAVTFKSGAVKAEFFDLLQRRITNNTPQDRLSRCEGDNCKEPQVPPIQQEIDNVLRQLTKLSGEHLKGLPELSLLRVKTGGDSAEDLVYSLVHNQQRQSLLLGDIEWLRQPEQDDLTIIPGCLGSYPNMFFEVYLADLQNFAQQLTAAKTPEQFDSFYSRYALRRNDGKLWLLYDWLAQQCRSNDSAPYWLDLSRYQNR